MKLRYILKKSLNIKNSYAIIILSTMILIACGYFSYALFTTYSESKGALNIVTGNLYSMIESSDLSSDKSITITPGDTKIVKLKLSNVNSIDAKVNLYYTSTSNNIDIGYLSSGDAAPTNTGYVLKAYGTTGYYKKIYVKITNNDTVNTTVTFGSDVGLSTATLSFPTGKNILNRTEGTIKNNNILVAYTYQEDTAQEGFCITGEEKTCVVTNCIDDTTSDACPAGTVIKYHVNDTTDLFFNVLYDKEGVLTMQQRENTIYSTEWYEDENDNTKGPITVLAALEEATSAWDNVNSIEYTAGETEFGTGDFKTANTACTWTEGATVNASQCSAKTYPDFTKTNVKARMITAQEAGEMGCKMHKSDGSSDRSCKKFMNNYLYQSTSYGGTVEDDYHTASEHNWGYWTMSSSSDALHIWTSGLIYTGYGTNSPHFGARAVVEVYKKL